ncbi:TPA: hypothetical protein I7730_01390 [Vibrio vulnificus]|uniref:Large polyvalent protein associated domain-containing protein n=1 Tax=Vibrio vulnificus TaxID=672 RepID=A0A8H9K5K2_VIBVL|nr:hypothetical protein [Vibrio vulnificus]
MTTYFQFAGVQSNTANKSTLERAKEMHANRRHPMLIWKDTGWELGLDGHWRYEIDDSKSSLNIEKFENAKKYAYHFHELHEILDHPELYEAYPALKYVNIHIDSDENSGYRGYYSRARKLIVLNSTALGDDMSQVFSTLHHEVQHAIQDIEGFARGGNTDKSFVDDVKALIRTRQEEATNKVSQWEIDNKDVLAELEDAERNYNQTMYFVAWQKLFEYANSPSPSRHWKHISEWATLLYNADFQVQGGAGMEARELSMSAHEIPRSNYKGKRTKAIGEFAARVGLFYRDYIDSSLRSELRAELENVTLNTIKSRAVRRFEKARNAISELVDLKAIMNEHAKLSDKVSYMFSTELYRSLTGEVEARNTQERLYKSAEERAEVAPFLTEDVPRTNQISMFEHELRETMRSRANNQEVAKGYVSFGNKHFAEIVLLEHADPSTIIHEAAHVYLAAYSDLYKDQDSSLSIRKDFETILNWFEVTPDEWFEMTPEQQEIHHEVFATGYEQFLIDSSSAPEGLKGVFSEFGKWIKGIYDKLSNSPAIKEVTADMEELFRSISETQQENYEPSPFALALRGEMMESLGDSVSIAASYIIDSTYEALAEKAGISRENFNERFNISVSGQALSTPKLNTAAKFRL